MGAAPRDQIRFITEKKSRKSLTFKGSASACSTPSKRVSEEEMQG